MANIFYIAIILLQVGVIIYFVGRERKQAKSDAGATAEEGTYEGRRSLAIGVTPQQLKLTIPNSETFVYGVIMDWNTGDKVITLATYINGAANLFFNSGGGIHGGGKNPNVGEAAVKFVTTAQEFIGSALPASISDIPSKDCVRFYLLTNKRLYAAQEQVKHFDNSTSAWLPLFEKGKEVIAEMMN